MFGHPIVYPLVNIQKSTGKITMLLMGQLTISMAIFNEAGGGVPRTTCLGAGG